MVPRENKNNAYSKFGGTKKKSIMVFPEVACSPFMITSSHEKQCIADGGTNYKEAEVLPRKKLIQKIASNIKANVCILS